MQHLIILVYAGIFSTGFAAIVSLVVLRVRARSAITVHLAVIQLLFMAGVALVAVYFYLKNMMGLLGGPSSAAEMVFGSISAVISAALYLSLFALVRRLQGSTLTPSGRLLGALLLVTGSVVLASLLVHLYALQNGGSSLRGVLSMITYILTTLSIGLFGLFVIRHKDPSQPPVMQQLLQGLGICSLAFIPLTVIEVVLEQTGFQPYHPLSMDYLFYLGCNLVIIRAALQVLLQEQHKLPPSTQRAAVPPERIQEYRLTARECEVVPCIAQGMTNKEIAQKLCISPATVRTHLYNLFQKTDVTNRIELLNSLYDQHE